MARYQLSANALVFALLCIATGVVTAADLPAKSEPLPRDPNNVYGTFDNGVSYIIRKASNPPGKVSLDLHVRTGALNESDQQNGLAHFLEHMAFKGSIHYEPGRLLPLLAHLGMSFGADTNAHTNLQETVFKLSLPNTEPQSIDTALSILADDAGGLKILPEEIDHERGVILEEMRTRKGAGQRMDREMRRALYGDARIVTHDVLGDEEQIRNAPQSEFLDYWNTWYRPENLTLIVVGDVDPDAVATQAKEKFGRMMAHGAARAPQSAGLKPTAAPVAVVLTDPEQTEARVVLECQKSTRPLITTVEQYRREVVDHLAEWIVNRRGADDIAKGHAPFRSLALHSGSFLDETFEVGAQSTGEAGDWKAMLSATIDQVHRAIDSGFTARELDLARRQFISSAEWSATTESSLDSKLVVANMANLVGLRRPMLSAGQRLDLARRIAATLSVEELHEAFVENFKTRNYAYVVYLPASAAGSTLPTQQSVLAAAEEAWSNQPTPMSEVAAVDTILAHEPQQVLPVSKTADEQLGLTTFQFANGLVLHHKFNDYKKEQVIVQITLPGGQLEETPATRGISALASEMVSRPATRRLTSTEMNDLLTGKNISVRAGIGLDSLSIRVSGSPADLATGLQVANAVLTDGVLEQATADEWKKRQLNFLSAKPNSATAQLAEIYSQTVLAGDIRLQPLDADAIERQKRSAAEEWFHRIAANAAIEVAVVGDITADRAAQLIGQYLGSLPQRKGGFDALDSLRKLDRSAGPYVKSVSFHGITPKAMVLAGYIGCDETNPDRWPLTLASMILSERMIERIRIEDHLVYSIRCRNVPGQGIAGLGTIQVSVPTDPKNTDRLISTIHELMSAFVDKGPTADELDTAKRQIANIVAPQMKEPDFWISQLADFKYHNRSLEELKQLPAVFQSFTPEQVQKAFSKYATPSGAISLSAVPSDAVSTVSPGQK